MPTERVFDPEQPAHLARLRKVVAGMIKNLVAARTKGDPDWCQSDVYGPRWFSTTQLPKHSVLYLLDQAVGALRLFNEEYNGPLDSVPYADENDESPIVLVERLKDLICQSISQDEVEDAVATLRGNKKTKVAWDKLADWSLLPELRDLLDEFPESPNQSGPAHT